jgi:maleylacetoacetate isomerase/maleylpyruvate isomerase
MALLLHDYFRSSATYRVRIALNMKGLPYRQQAHHLAKGEHRAPDYLSINPQGFVPALADGGVAITQSVAIIEYLEEAYPDTPRVLPATPAGRARVRSLAAIVATDTHPLNNLRVLKYLETELGLDEEARRTWYHRWLKECFDALEARLRVEAETGRFCHGDGPTLADICLVPQIFDAKRFAFDLSPYPTVMRIFDAAQALDAFASAAPDRQPDAE